MHLIVENPALDCKKEHVKQALDIAVRHKRINTAMVQRGLRLGYAEASRIMDELELQGFIGPHRGVAPGRLARHHVMHNDNRTRPKRTRKGHTHKIKIHDVTIYVTVNAELGEPLELFVKSDGGWQGWCDMLSVTASMALQYGCPLKVILNKWRGARFPPDSIGAASIPDAIARKLLPTCADD